ncbi:MAG: ABC transporter ATP-binding protein/permease [Lactobacillales bacterium]|nr:ABC transporter ATP-binding protein/permease [Lactobacillales bacterium]
MIYLYLFKSYWKYAEKNKWRVVCAIISYIFSNGFYLTTPLLFAQILNKIQVKGMDIRLSDVWGLLLAWVFCFFFSNVVYRIGRYFEIITAYRVKQNFIREHYDILTRISIEWHTNHHSGDLINRINKAATSLSTFARNQRHYIKYFLYLTYPLIVLSFISIEVSLISCVIALLSVIMIRFFDKKLHRAYARANEIQHKVSATFYDFVSNIRSIIILKLSRKTAGDLNQRIEDGFKIEMYADIIISQSKWFCISLFNMFLRAGVVIYYITVQVLRQKQIMIGNVSAIFQYLNLLCDKFADFMGDLEDMLRYKTDIESVDPIIKAANKGTPAEILPVRKKWKMIDIKHLSFDYLETKAVLKDVSFSIPRGAKIALIGESGSGKTTLMHFLRGLYNVPQVTVYVDGERQEQGILSLSQITTLMPQDPEVFENSIEYNITMEIKYPKKRLEEALRLSRFEKVLQKLPLGLKTDVREKGVNLSGGERQRLALTRNILAAYESDIILMDEPTSSVDPENEKAIYDNILSHFQDKTIISSIHKLYLLDKFDYVIKLEKGGLIEQKNTLKK